MVNKNPSKIQNMFNKIAKRYDFLNGIISFGTHKIIKQIAFKNLKIKPGGKILDLCTGTGDVSRILKDIEPKAEVVGLDFSQNMLDIAKKRFQNIDFIKGDVCNLEFEDNFFDIVTISFGLRNIEDKDKALSEIKRVLKNDGYFAHLDFSCLNNFFNFIFDKTTLCFAKLFSKNYEAYEYLINSKKEFEKPDELVNKFEKTGFKIVLKKGFMFDTICLIVCKK